jgi:paraquat-inducible protein A
VTIKEHHLYRETLSVCPYCDLVVKSHNLAVNQYTLCPRCHSKVEHEHDCCPHFLKWTVIAALFFYIPANFFPLVSVELAGQLKQTSVFDGIVMLIHQGNHLTAAIILFCSLIVPTLVIVIFTALLISRHYQVLSGFQRYCARLLVQLRHWSMLDIYLISFLVTMFKIKSMGDIQIQIGLFAFIGLTLSINKLFISYDRAALWRLVTK